MENRQADTSASSRSGGADVADAKARAAASIAQAQAELDRALAEIDTIKTVNPALIGLIAHSLSNSITVAAATVEMLQLTLRDYPDADVAVWLDGLGRTTDLMQHSLSRLVTMSAPSDFPLKLEQVNLRVLMERACEYYRRRADTRQLYITCGAVGAVPLAWGDRVALALVADNLLSHAVRAALPHGTVAVQILPEPGHVVCRIRFSGPGVSRGPGDRQLDADSGALPDQESDYGLAIAGDYLHRLDGDLSFVREQDLGGLCFSFRLPALE